MDFISKLKKKVEGAVAQVNPLDGGKTYSSVVNTPSRGVQRAPVPTPSSGNSITNNPLTRGFSRAFDQINPGDNGRTWQQRTPTNNFSVSKQLRESKPASMAGAIIRDARDTADIAGTGITSAVGGNKYLQDELSETVNIAQKAQGNYLRDFRAGKIDKPRFEALMHSADEGLSSTLKQNKKITDYSDPRRVGASVGEIAATVATAGVGGVGFQGGKAAAKQVIKQGVKQTVKDQATKQAVKTVARDVSTGAALGGVTNALSSLKQEEMPTLDDLLGDVKTGAMMGAAVPVAGAALGAATPFVTKTAQKTAEVTADAAKRANTHIAANNPDVVMKRKVVDHINKTGERLRASGATARELAENKRALELATQDYHSTMNSISQGGYVKLPGGDDGLAPNLPKPNASTPETPQLPEPAQAHLPVVDDVTNVMRQNPMLPENIVKDTPFVQASIGNVAREVQPKPIVSHAPVIENIRPELATPVKNILPAPEDLQRAFNAAQQNDHAFVYKESPYQRVMARRGADGQFETWTEQKAPDGTYRQVHGEELPIQSPNDLNAIDDVYYNENITNIASKAAQEGGEFNYVALNNENGRGVSVVPFDEEKWLVVGGVVRDQMGVPIGNLVKVTPEGVSITMGKKTINLHDIMGDASKWKNVNEVSSTLDRILEKAAPDEATYLKTRDFTIAFKNAQEAKMKTDLQDLRQNLAKQRNELMAIKPFSVSKDEFSQDIFRYAERRLVPKDHEKGMRIPDQNQVLVDKYGEDIAAKVIEFDNWARETYDNLLNQVNKTLVELGQEPVERRANYMTHLQEKSLWEKLGLSDEVFQNLQAGITGEMNGNTRGGLPGTIAGLTGDFKPTKKWNPFHMRRHGNESAEDPFKAMDAYSEAAMFNIYMTEPAMRMRAMESALRASEDVLQQSDALQQIDEALRTKLTKANEGKRGDLTTALQEVANAYAGKSNRYDRALIDSGKWGRFGLKTAQLWQRIAGQSSIVGNVSVTLAQSLNLPQTIKSNGIRATTKGIVRQLKSLGRENAAWRNSDALKLRYADASSIDKSGLQKMNDAVSTVTLMPFVERAFVKLAWNSSYENALSKGLKGKAALREADRIAERIYAGRGIGDQPEIYRSVAGKTFLQYTLEVSAAWKNVRPGNGNLTVKQAAELAAATWTMNWVMEQVTGRKPLPDLVDATISSWQGWNEESDASGVEKALDVAGRFGAEVINAIPGASALTNAALSKEDRKAIFGDETDLGRYEGTPAAASAFAKLLRAGGNLARGEFDEAASNAMSVVPYGSQIRKTVQGARSMDSGEYQNSDGDTLAEIDNNDPIRLIQAVLFGRNAIPEVQEYHDEKQSGGAVKAKLSGNAGDILDDLNADTEEKRKALKKLFSSDDWELANLSNDERDALLESGYLTQDKVDGLTKYELNKKRELGLTAGGEGQDVPKFKGEIADDVKEFYKDRSYVYDNDVDTWKQQRPDQDSNAYKMVSRANQMHPEGMPDLPETNEVAEMYADFSKRRAEAKWGETKENAEKIKFLKKAYKTSLNNEQQEWYGLSDTALTSAIESGEVANTDLDELIAFDDMLRSHGFTGDIGNTLRRDFGYQEWHKGKSGGSGGRGSKSTAPSLSAGFFDTGSTMAALYKLLDKANL